MVKQVTSYETTDGKKFTNEAEANGHEVLISIAKVVDAYIAAAGLQPAEATRAKKYISGFTAFADDYEGDDAYSEEELAAQAEALKAEAAAEKAEAAKKVADAKAAAELEAA